MVRMTPMGVVECLFAIVRSWNDQVKPEYIIHTFKLSVIPSVLSSGKYRFFLTRLSHAYHGLAMILSIIKQEVSKHDRAWVKPSPPMNSAYQRLIVWLTLHLG
jgi:hypothetical protein